MHSMTPEERLRRSRLRRSIEEAALAIESYIESCHDSSRFKVRIRTEEDEEEDYLTMVEGQRLLHGLYLLLPPRGPTSILDCPHCGNPVKVILSK